MHPDADRGRSAHKTELARITSAYRQRDATQHGSPYTFANPGYAFYLQRIEWALLAALRRAHVDPRRARVLEVGCGGGYFLHRLVEFGAAHATGVDLMPERIAAAERRYPTLELHCGDAATLPFEAGAFDIVTQFTCLSSVLDADVRTAIAAEMWRVTRPGGAIVSFDIRPANTVIRSLRWAGRRRGGSPDRGTPTVGIDRDELERVFPGVPVRYRTAGLAFGLCRVAGISELAAHALARLPVLREHAIATVLKP